MTDLMAFTVVGIVTGCIYAVAATGLVVTYTTSGIFNFAHGAVGMFMAFVYWELRSNQGWPAPIALIVVLFVLAPLLGALLERLLMRKLQGAPTGVTLVVTLGVLVALLGVAQSIWSPTIARTLPPFFAGNNIRLFDVVVTYHQLVVVACAGLIAFLLRLLLFHTRIGVTMRAIVDDRELGSLNGAYPERVAQLSWAMGATLAAAAGILLAPEITLNHLNLTLLVVNGYAAAMLGKLKNLPLTFVGAIILGLGYAYSIGYGSSFKLLADLKPIIPTIFLFAILVFLPQAPLRSGRLVGSRAPRVPGLRESVVGAAVLVTAVGLLSTQMSEFWLFNVGSALVIGIVMLSLVLLTGYAGQVSLMQMAFVGVGALTMGRIGGGSIVGVLAAALFAGIFGAIVALPALRLQNLYLALTTLAFALFAEWAFGQRWLFDQGGLLAVDRLRLPGVEFGSEQSQVVLLVIVFSLIAIGVLAIRRGPYGRRLAAMRDSPVACATLGLNMVSTKTAVFAVSAAIAGVAGAMYGGLRTSVSANDFVMLQSLFVFLVATFGGINTVTGALFGGVFLAILPELQKHVDVESLQFLLIGLGAIALADNPNGFGGNIAMIGDKFRELRGRGPGPAAPAAAEEGGADAAEAAPAGREEVLVP